MDLKYPVIESFAWQLKTVLIIAQKHGNIIWKHSLYSITTVHGYIRCYAGQKVIMDLLTENEFIMASCNISQYFFILYIHLGENIILNAS